ncbi:hypothetical protein K3G39_13870 [Pontibacter sp. HSC-14F20]|uniref:hypothetical protein n=1 Tax=Pontibacter sp. HSC-14F20 TaxID=2864136 RepID=UPI001C7307C1|nr:hypothetical protein [Pontibacter sp. HSC-14F20]MBX0334326.1 hypothetical protein [Pontibacter sp. HSC-14F20]
MKKKADPTIPIASRIDTYTNAQLLRGAASMEMSRSQYVAHVLTRNLRGKTSQKMQERLVELTQQLETLQQQVKDEIGAIWKQEPFASFLQKLLHNDKVLAALYTTYSETPFPTEMRNAHNFYPGIFLTGGREGDKVFHLTGTYGWAYTDEKKSHVMIKKRN